MPSNLPRRQLRIPTADLEELFRHIETGTLADGDNDLLVIELRASWPDHVRPDRTEQHAVTVHEATQQDDGSQHLLCSFYPDSVMFAIKDPDHCIPLSDIGAFCVTVTVGEEWYGDITPAPIDA